MPRLSCSPRPASPRRPEPGRRQPAGVDERVRRSAEHHGRQHPAAHLRDNFQHLGRDIERERGLHSDDHDCQQERVCTGSDSRYSQCGGCNLGQRDTGHRRDADHYHFHDLASRSSGGLHHRGTVTGNIAIAGSQYPQVFNNDLVDANFGIREPIFLDQIPATTSLVTSPISTIEVPNSDTNPTGDQLVTSFSSKSELALNQSTDGQYVSFMGYHAPTAAIDASNANTPSEQDTTNTDTANGGAGYYRDAAVMSDSGNFQFTETGAYGGNNGRSAIFNPSNNTIFTAGNAGNGGKPSFQGW